MQRVVIIGCGYVGRRLARRVLESAPQAEITALTHDVVHADELRALGVSPVAGDLDHDGRPEALSLAAATLFYFAPPPPSGEQDTRMARFVAWLAAGDRPDRIVYLSTTGVYGDCRGEWVDEQAELRPQAARAKRRVDAEHRVLTWGEQHDVPVVVLRVPGIYGPDRLPRARLARGAPVLKPELAPITNRIHVDDLVTASLAAAERGQAGEAYNVADDQPLNMSDYFFRVADALGLPRPPLIDMAQAQESMSPALLSYQQESRRIDNRRLHEELKVRLRYPDLQSGLSASL